MNLIGIAEQSNVHHLPIGPCSMPYQQYRDFPFPSHKRDQVIWRYVDVPKFASMLMTNSLYHSVPEHLSDRWEGLYMIALNRHIYDEFQGQFDILRLDFGEARQSFLAQSRCWAVNCWYMDDNESMAMWQIYGPGGSGIVIKSTIGRLIDATADNVQEAYLLEIDYSDFINLPNTASPSVPWLLSRKRSEFRFENELRSLVKTQPLEPDEEVQRALELAVRNGTDIHFAESVDGALGLYKYPLGYALPVSLPKLISEVRLIPGMPKWQHDVIANLMQNYHLDVPLRASRLHYE